MATPTPITAFTPVFKPLTQITPFTFRDGYTFLEMYSELRQYLVKLLGPEIDEKLTLIYTETQAMVNALADDVNASKDAWQELFDEFMANVIVELEALNDIAVANLVNNLGSNLRSALDGIYATKGEMVVLRGDLSTFTNDSNANFLAFKGEVATELAKFVPKDSLLVNVMDYGAKTNGTDATSAVQAAANVAAGGTLFFPPGNYRINGVVELKNNTTISGYGATLFKDGASGQSSYAFFCTLSHGRTGYGSGGSNIVARGLRFKGKFSNSAVACAFALHHTENFTATECIFEEMHGSGHIFDLAGCKNVEIYNNTFLGALDNQSRGEAVQLDVSALGALSVLDDAGSHDALPSVMVNVHHNKFLPLVIGATFYPASVPMGSHAEWENVWFRDVSFTDNIVDSPRLSGGISPVGVIHFSMVDRLTVARNTFRARPGASPYGRVVAVSYPESHIVAGTNPNAPQNPSVTAVKIPSRNIDVNSNRFIGFNNASDNSDVLFINTGEVVNISDNTYEGCASFIDVREVNDVTIIGNKFTKPAAALGFRLLNLNRVRRFSGTGNVIDVVGSASINELVYISNASYWGFFNQNIVHGLGPAGIVLAEGSSIDIANNNTTL